MPWISSAVSPTALEAEVLVFSLFEGAENLPDLLASSPIGPVLRQKLESRDLSTAVGECSTLFAPSGFSVGTLLLIGLGPRSSFGPAPSYQAGFAAAKKLGSRSRGHVGIVLPGGPTPETTDLAFVEGCLAGLTGPGLRKSEPVRFTPQQISVLADRSNRLVPPDIEGLIRRAKASGEAVALARELANCPPRDKTPALLARRFREEGTASGLTVEVWGPDRIVEERFGGLLGVSAGSDEPPAFVQLSLNHEPREAPSLALVGKGVTFDSGGLSLKPSASMEDMKADMSGAAAVYASLLAAARLGFKTSVSGFIPLTENMTGGRAMKLGDVLTMRNGKTVEVLNTDAEGRLILADALAFAAEKSPGRIVDLATLTGACMVALGPRVAGLFSNHEEVASEILRATQFTGERVWRLPLDDDYRELLKSQVADLKNVGGKWGGAITAAKFLETFVASRPWAHLDIAGPSWSDSESSTQDAGATGCFVRSLIRLMEQPSPVTTHP